MNSFRSVINFPGTKTSINFKKQFAYLGLELISKYQQQLSDYLKYSTNISNGGNVNVTVTPVQQKYFDTKNTNTSTSTYKFHVICK